MPRYVSSRLVSMLIVLAVVTFGLFAMFYWVSPDPAYSICGKFCEPERAQQIHQALGLDLPLWQQFTEFITGIFRGRDYFDGGTVRHCPAPCLGYSFQSQQPVWQMLTDRLGVTLAITIGAAVLWLLTGLAAGLLAAIKKGSWFDKAAMGLSTAGISIPNYVFALFLQYVLVVTLGWLPFPEVVRFGDDPGQWFLNLVMPWITLSFYYSAYYTRLTKANVLDTLQEDYVRTARSKGLSSELIWRRHALRPALTPLMTILGMDIAGLMAGSIVVESVFNLNGIGKLAAASLGSNDQPVIMAVTLLASVLVLGANLLVDIAYTFVDPRVRVSAA